MPKSVPPKRASFGGCPACAYRDFPSIDRCYACFRESVPTIRSASHCPVCQLPLSGDRCGNPICNFDDRWFSWNRALGFMSKGQVLHTVIRQYKYGDSATQWGVILGHILAGHLEEHSDLFGSFDWITPAPTFVGTDSRRSWDHVALVFNSAADVLGPNWPFAEEGSLIEKTADSPSMVEMGSWQDRHEAAKALSKVLHVPSRTLVSGKRVLVFDDVFTDGHTLQQVAHALRRAGASEVCGISLARQSWGR